MRCKAFPFVVLTSNGERDLPPAFTRRCLRLEIEKADDTRLRAIVSAHLGKIEEKLLNELLATFTKNRDTGQMANDQLLNALFLITRGRVPDGAERQVLTEAILRELDR